MSAPSLFDYIDDICFSKKNILKDEYLHKYPKYMIVKFLSCKEEYVVLAQLLNRYQSVWGAKEFHEFALEVVPKKKCYIKYSDVIGKPLIKDVREEIEVISKYFEISNDEAYNYYSKCPWLVEEIGKLFGK